MKADFDETIENLNEGLQVSKNSEVSSESRVQKPEVPALTQADIENFYFDLSKCKTKPVLLSLVPTTDSKSKEISITFTPGSSIICFWTRFLPIAAFHVHQQDVSHNDLWLFRLTWWQLQDWLEAF